MAADPARRGTIAVTGANRGIGAAIALALARAGFGVACLTRSGGVPDAGEDSALRARLLPLRCDVLDEQAVAAALALAAEGAGGLIGLVNNAGLHTDAKSAELATADYERVMAVNATAVFATARAAYPHLARAGGGLIVNIGSFFDKLGVKRNLAYCASKAAVGAITRCLAVEWAAQNIRVVDVAPGYIVTDLNRAMLSSGPLRAYLDQRIPRGEPGNAEEVARLVAALFREDLRFLSGETIYVDGAQGIAH
ncbi:MAG: SDR family oxidoreductase [Burkholderiales bacterium]|nr:SDR family oxidoreductase [Burkholderiales bacterium]